VLSTLPCYVRCAVHPGAGETVLSHEVAALVGDSCVLEALGGGTSRLLQLLEPYQLPPEVGGWVPCWG
jgi:hypothetical protein